jgi:hypothetical protein
LEKLMETSMRADNLALLDASSAVSWGSIAAGAVTACSVSLALLALGAGLGLSAVSPWSDSGVSASTFKNGTGVYLVLVAIMSSAIGGYLAARLRTKWTGIHTNEAFFRDTAHGFIAWGFATLLSASLLGSAATHVVGGAASGLGTAAGQAAQNANPSQIYVDRLFRTDATVASPAATGASSPGGNPGANSGASSAVQSEVSRLWASGFRDNADLAAADRAYVARLVATQTGMTQVDAERRVNEVIVEAKATADTARKGAAKLAFWMTAALFFGAFAASLAAVEGGQLRDGTWNERHLVRRPW